MLLRESVSAFTDATIIVNERSETLKESLPMLLHRFRSPLGHHATVRTDPASSLRSLATDKCLRSSNISIELGDEKNVNKNPISEKGIEELRSEIVKLQPQGGKISPLVLSQAVSNLNSRIRQNKLSAYEVWTARDMSTGAVLKLNDTELIKNKVKQRMKDHAPSAKYKARGHTQTPPITCKRGDIVYLIVDRDKSRSRDKYLVVDVNKDYATVQKFTGLQFRARKYRVKLTDIITVPSISSPSPLHTPDQTAESSSDDSEYEVIDTRDAVENQPDQTDQIVDERSDDESEDEITFSDLLPRSLQGENQRENRRQRIITTPRYLEDYIDPDSLDLSGSLDGNEFIDVYPTVNTSESSVASQESDEEKEKKDCVVEQIPENVEVKERPKRNLSTVDYKE